MLHVYEGIFVFMLYLEFKGYGPGQDVSLGPSDGFRVVGRNLLDASTDEVLARYKDHVWHVGGKVFTRCECKGKASVQFKNSDLVVTHGPFDSLSFVDGALYNAGGLLAQFHAESWRVSHTQNSWPVMILATA